VSEISIAYLIIYDAVFVMCVSTDEMMNSSVTEDHESVVSHRAVFSELITRYLFCFLGMCGIDFFISVGF